MSEYEELMEAYRLAASDRDTLRAKLEQAMSSGNLEMDMCLDWIQARNDAAFARTLLKHLGLEPIEGWKP
jgi:hypothetical protein